MIVDPREEHLFTIATSEGTEAYADTIEGAAQAFWQLGRELKFDGATVRVINNQTHQLVYER